MRSLRLAVLKKNHLYAVHPTRASPKVKQTPSDDEKRIFQLNFLCLKKGGRQRRNFFAVLEFGMELVKAKVHVNERIFIFAKCLPSKKLILLKSDILSKYC